MNRRRQDPIGPRPFTVLVAVVLAFGALGNADFAEELNREAEAKETRPKRLATNCPARNAVGEWKRAEVTQCADGGHCWHQCYYVEASL